MCLRQLPGKEAVPRIATNSAQDHEGQALVSVCLWGWWLFCALCAGALAVDRLLVGCGHSRAGVCAQRDRQQLLAPLHHSVYTQLSKVGRHESTCPH